MALDKSKNQKELSCRPKNVRIAYKADFISKGKLRHNLKFWVHTFHSEEYEPHYVDKNFWDKWIPWLIQKRIYIKITETDGVIKL